MNKLKQLFSAKVCFAFFCLSFWGSGFAAETATTPPASPDAPPAKIILTTEYYADGHFSIGLIDPKDEEIVNYKPKGIKEPLIKHTSVIGDTELAVVYLDYASNPKAISLWKVNPEQRNALISAFISTDVPMSEDYAYQKLWEKEITENGYSQREVRYKVKTKDAEYIYALRFIRRGLDEYVLFYKGPVAGDSSLTPEDFFSTFEIKN